MSGAWQKAIPSSPSGSQRIGRNEDRLRKALINIDKYDTESSEILALAWEISERITQIKEIDPKHEIGILKNEDVEKIEKEKLKVVSNSDATGLSIKDRKSLEERQVKFMRSGEISKTLEILQDSVSDFTHNPLAPRFHRSAPIPSTLTEVISRLPIKPKQNLDVLSSELAALITILGNKR